MNGREKRKKRSQRARDAAPMPRGTRDPWGGLCPNGCGEPGPHYVPPSLGDSGFFTCTPAGDPDEVIRPSGASRSRTVYLTKAPAEPASPTLAELAAGVPLNPDERTTR